MLPRHLEVLFGTLGDAGDLTNVKQVYISATYPPHPCYSMFKSVWARVVQRENLYSRTNALFTLSKVQEFPSEQELN